jgi:hypothetical protein
VAGSFTYLIACEVGAQTVEAQSTVVVSAPAPAAGGGGSLDLVLLGSLAACLCLRALGRGGAAIRH